MKNKILWMSTGFLVLGAGILGGLVFFQKVYKTVNADQQNINDVSKLVTADYLNKERNEPTAAVTRDVKFSGFDPNRYEIMVKNIKTLNRSSILVTFSVKDKTTETHSYQRTLKISGFKKIAATQEKLNEKIDLIHSVKYTEDNSKILAANAENSKFVFSAVKGDYQVVIKSKTPKSTDQTVLVITFVVKEINGSIESKLKTLEAFGFRDPNLIPIPTKTKSDLDSVVNNLSIIKYKDNTNNILVSEAKSEKLYFDLLDSDYKLYVNSIKPNPTDSTTAIINFSISENGGTIKSIEKTIELKGFRKIPKTKNELDKLLLKITTATYEGNKAKVEISKIEKGKIKVNNLEEGLELVVHDVYPNNTNPTTAVVVYSIREKGLTLESTKKELMIMGFMKSAQPPLSKDELNKIANNIKNLSYKGQPISEIEFSKIDKSLVEFTDLNHFYVPEIETITPKTNDASTVIVNFTIKEAGGSVKSDIKAIEWSGFKIS